MREYKGFTITRVTKNDWVVRKDGIIYHAENGRIPRTLKEAKATIDKLTAQEETL